MTNWPLYYCVAGDGLLGAAGLPPGTWQSPHLDEVCGQDQLPVRVLGSLCLLQGVYLCFKVHSFNFGKHDFRSSTPISCWMDQSILGNSHWWNSSLSSSWYKKQLLRLVVSRLIFNSIFFNCSFFQMLSIRGVIPCIPYISGKAKGFLILASVVAVEALIFGVIQFAYYYRCFCKTVWPHSLTNWCC